MCLPDQVVVFADCAVNPDPDASQLAEIAIQSADSALAFGLPARVAMLSYSTGSSGTGADVDKVVKATALARETLMALGLSAGDPLKLRDVPAQALLDVFMNMQGTFANFRGGAETMIGIDDGWNRVVHGGCSHYTPKPRR
jgi:hypothetical protein